MKHNSLYIFLFTLAILITPLGGCAVVSVAGSITSAAVSVASTGISLAGTGVELGASGAKAVATSTFDAANAPPE